MPWGIAAAAVGAVGAYAASSNTASATKDAAAQSAAAADPFAQYRGQFGSQLSNSAGSLASPLKMGQQSTQFQTVSAPDAASTAANPAYQFTLNQGIANQDRSAASQGLLGSGQAAAELSQYTTGLANQTYLQDWSAGVTQAQANNQAISGYNSAVAGNNQSSLNSQNQWYQQLAQLSGATTGSPGMAGQAILTGGMSAANTTGSAISGLAGYGSQALSNYDNSASGYYNSSAYGDDTQATINTLFS